MHFIEVHHCTPSKPTPTPPLPCQRADWYRAALLLIIVCVSLLRLAGIFNDFWLDEIWSWQFAMSAHSARDILFNPAFHHDNNHVLNTLFMYALGDQQNWRFYRLLSPFTGVGMVILCAMVACRWGRFAALAATILTGFSYMFVHFSSEARGYAPAAFFALMAYWLLRQFIDHVRRSQPSPRRALFGLTFGITCILGFLSHASFIYAFAGAMTWIPVALLRLRRGRLNAAKDLLALFFVPWLFLTWFHRAFIRPMTIGGGPSTTLPDLLAQTCSFTLGLPAGPIAAWVGITLLLAIALAGAWMLWREGSDEWIFLLVSGLIAPAVILGVHHDQMYPRYLYIALPFVALLAARAVAGLNAGGQIGSLAATLMLLSFVCGNLLHITRFLASGRGHYFAAVEYISAHTTERTIMVGGYSEFRTTMLLNFYTARMPRSGRQFRYVPDSSPRAPEWYLFTPRVERPIVKILVEPQWKTTYELKAEYAHYGLAGWDWGLYRRLERP